MIVRQRLEWSLGVHVRLARVSCGATLPIPDCLQTVTSYQGHAGYNYIPTLASSPYLYFVSLPPWPTPSLLNRDLLAALPSLPVLFYSDAVLIVKRRASQPSRSQGIRREIVESGTTRIESYLPSPSTAFCCVSFFFFFLFNYLSLGNSIDIISRDYIFPI